MALLIVLTTLFSNVCYASTANSESAQLNALSVKYHLKDLTQLPAGKSAFKFDSVAQADAFLGAIQNKMSTSDPNMKPSASAQSSVAMKAASYPYGTQVYSVYSGFPAEYENLQIGYSYYYNTSLKRNCFYSLLGISSYLSGTDWCTTWTPGIPYGYVYNGGLNIYAQQQGVLSVYLLVNGLYKLYSYSETWSHTFSNP